MNLLHTAEVGGEQTLGFSILIRGSATLLQVLLARFKSAPTHILSALRDERSEVPAPSVMVPRI